MPFGYHLPTVKRTLFVPLALCVVWLAAPPVQARNAGFPSESCGGCHRGGRDFKPTITFEPAKIEPGQTVLLTVHVPAVNGPAAGIYMQSNRKGEFEVVAGGGLVKVDATSVMHNTPRIAEGNESTFQVRWKAPATAGGVEFDVTAVSGNRNGGSGGDGEGFGRTNLSYGCEGVDAFLDQDLDTWGIPDPRGGQRFCELPMGYSLKPGDCNDYDKNANPMGREICNLYDDDCDGMINEGLDTETVYPDMDRDGHGGRFGTAQMGCPQGGFGFSSTRDDCDDTNKDIKPSSMEVCNGRDDNCNNRIDEGARASCGVGWCRRLAPSCAADTCVPGPPKVEVCNAFDDDCDNVVDNGDNLCMSGMVCHKGLCLTKEEAAEAEARDPTPPPPDGGAAGGSGGSGGGSSGAGGSSGSGGSGANPGRGGSGTQPAGGGDNKPRVGCRYGDLPNGQSSGLSVGLLLALSIVATRIRAGRKRR
jgi:Putative metal-binding motif